MKLFPFIDVHTHRFQAEKGLVTVRNLMPGEAILSFTGKNFFSVGLHPWKIKSKEENDHHLLMMEDALELDHLIFVGECGIDKLAETSYDEQIRAFKAQMFMAEEYQKPLIIHCVKAWSEIMEIHKKNRPTVPWILHGYNGNPEITQQLSGKKFLFSFGEMLLRENVKAVESFRVLPLDELFFETDEFDGTVEKIYQRGAELKNISVETLKEAVWENFNRIENVSFAI